MKIYREKLKSWRETRKNTKPEQPTFENTKITWKGWDQPTVKNTLKCQIFWTDTIPSKNLMTIVSDNDKLLNIITKPSKDKPWLSKRNTINKF